jgi:hypothetical protein
MEQLWRRKVVALDTESDSLYSYYPKVCLIQVSTYAGAEDDAVAPPVTVSAPASTAAAADSDASGVSERRASQGPDDACEVSRLWYHPRRGFLLEDLSE